jgi:erythromycin esterase-like protein
MHYRPILLRLLVGSLPLLSASAKAQRLATATDTLEEQAAARVATAVCNNRIVLLGELPSHGEARAFGVKSRIVKHLVANCGFRAVLFEAASYDFFGLERSIAARAPNDSLDLALARAMGGFWWTRELADWRQWLVREAGAGRVSIGGLDDQPTATAVYLRATLPGLVGAAVPTDRASECKDAITRHVNWTYTAALPYDSTEQVRLADCTSLAASRSAKRPRTPENVMLDNLAGYFARMRVVATRGDTAMPDRDLVMAENVAWWLDRLPNDAKVIVWTATVHAARAFGGQAVLPRAVLPVGARLSQRWGDRVAAIGFTAFQGQTSRAGNPSRPLDALPPNSLEAKALAAAAPNDGARWVFLDRAALRAIGAVPSRLFGKVTTIDWSTTFDGVVVLRDEVAPTFEPRR